MATGHQGSQTPPAPAPEVHHRLVTGDSPHAEAYPANLQGAPEGRCRLWHWFSCRAERQVIDRHHPEPPGQGPALRYHSDPVPVADHRREGLAVRGRVSARLGPLADRYRMRGDRIGSRVRVPLSRAGLPSPQRGTESAAHLVADRVRPPARARRHPRPRPLTSATADRLTQVRLVAGTAGWSPSPQPHQRVRAGRIKAEVRTGGALATHTTRRTVV
jgi:hypothetical protein